MHLQGQDRRITSHRAKLIAYTTGQEARVAVATVEALDFELVKLNFNTLHCQKEWCIGKLIIMPRWSPRAVTACRTYPLTALRMYCS